MASLAYKLHYSVNRDLFKIVSVGLADVVTKSQGDTLNQLNMKFYKRNNNNVLLLRIR